jgi:hypothetical protein
MQGQIGQCGAHDHRASIKGKTRWIDAAAAAGGAARSRTFLQIFAAAAVFR